MCMVTFLLLLSIVQVYKKPVAKKISTEKKVKSPKNKSAVKKTKAELFKFRKSPKKADSPMRFKMTKALNNNRFS